MGQISNKTYKAPDGSIYRVEDDGSVTKIKSGRVQTNEPPSKYQVTPDGKIYRVEPDGSVTYLGNAEERQTPHSPAPGFTQTPPEPKRHNNTLIGIIVVVLVVTLAVVIFAVANESTYSSDSYYPAPAQESYVDYSGDNEITAEATEAAEEAPATAEAVEEAPAAAESDEFWYERGTYRGTIGSSEIYGTLNIETDAPSGSLYYTTSSARFDLSGSPDGMVWYEYYGDQHTGTIALDYWNTDYYTFASGTYTRLSDGATFPISLHKN